MTEKDRIKYGFMSDPRITTFPSYSIIIDGDIEVRPRRKEHPDGSYLLWDGSLRVIMWAPLSVRQFWVGRWDDHPYMSRLAADMFDKFAEKSILSIDHLLLDKISVHNELVLNFHEVIIPVKACYDALPLSIVGWLAYKLDLTLHDFPTYAPSYYFPLKP